MKTLHIMRGLPGSGKSTKAKTLGRVCSTDDYRVKDGVYRFSLGTVGKASKLCRLSVSAMCRAGVPDVVVDNLHITRRAVRVYADIGLEFGYAIRIHDLFDSGLSDVELAKRGVHEVPASNIAELRRQYQPMLTRAQCILESRKSRMSNAAYVALVRVNGHEI